MSTTLVSQFQSGFERAKQLAHKTVLTFPYELDPRAVLLEVYAELTNGPVPARSDGYWEGDAHLDDAMISPRGDGYVQTHMSRGFMPGAGQSITHDLLVTDQLHVTVSDWWEDNIAGPDAYELYVAASSADELDRAAQIITAAAQRSLAGNHSYSVPMRPAPPVIAAVAEPVAAPPEPPNAPVVSGAARLFEFQGRLAQARRLAHKTVLTFPYELDTRAVLLEAYAALANEPAPAACRDVYWDGDEHLHVAMLGPRGDGYVQLHESRGMPGTGQTATQYLLVSDQLRVTVVDGWEDNIAGADSYELYVAASSADELDRAAKVLAAIALRSLLVSWKDSFPAPNRPGRDEVKRAIEGISDPAAAWAALRQHALTPSGIVVNLTWAFLEEQFETCSSCNGTYEDRHFGGACYACNHYGQHLIGYRRSDLPPTLEHVIAYGTHGKILTRLDDAIATLIARLIPWGGPDPAVLEWILEGPSLVNRADRLPACMVPVFDALRSDIDPTLFSRSGKGWFSHGRTAWRAACAIPSLGYAQRPDPFEPLETIMRAGYQADVTADAARLFCR